MIKAAQRGINAEKTNHQQPERKRHLRKTEVCRHRRKSPGIHVMNKRSLVVEIKDAKMLLFLR
jgi:hypothetical protein